jgi:dolichyl-phosphate beta-glucosyltransferase
MKLSIVIPAYNEEVCIENTLHKIIKHMKSRKIQNEILVIDDGSTDKTRNIVSKIPGIKLNNARKNKGKGYSVKEGMLIAKGDYLLFTDADLSTPIEEIDSFLGDIKKYDIVVASRALPQSEVKSSWYKILLGRIGNALISMLAVKSIKDTQCGFKLFTKKAAKTIFPKQTVDRWGFDFEILHIAQKLGFRIKERPVHWKATQKSKVKTTDYLKTLLELINIKLNDIRGVYGRD